MFKKQPTLSEQFKDCTSALRVFKNQNSDKSLSMDWFVISALRYQLSGRPFSELCETNADVAYHLDRPQVAQMWKMLQQLYSSPASRVGQFSGQGSFITVDSVGGDHKELDLKQSGSRHASGSVSGTATARHYSGSRSTMGTQTIRTEPSAVVQFSVEDPSNRSDSDEESDHVVGDVGVDTMVFHQNVVGGGEKVSKEADFFFGDGDATTSGLSVGFEISPNFLVMTDQLSLEDDTEELEELPREAFNLRHVIPAFPDPPEIADRGRDSPERLENEVPTAEESADDQGYISSSVLTNDLEAHCQSLLSSHMPPPPPFEFNKLVVDMLQFHAAQGDVQSCVSALIVIGDRLKSPSIDELTQECWFQSYIEILSRFQLWNVANQVICLSSLPNINSLNQTSTSLHINCGLCNKANNGSVAWLCQKCKTNSSRCSVCHRVVSGLYAWCQGCGHGGHLQHIQEWLAICRYCPSGCGHQCEYT